MFWNTQKAKKYIELQKNNVTLPKKHDTLFKQ